MVETKLFGEKEIAAHITAMAKEVLAHNKARLDTLVVIGIIARGSTIAERLVREIEGLIKKKLPYGMIDISIYRDDLELRGESVTMATTDIPVDINNKVIILVDDVIFKGRTIRAAMNVIHDFGRPAAIELYTLLDRGGRELPIAPTFSAARVDVSNNDFVQVLLKETDGKDSVVVKKDTQRSI
jgi:pyrimidine operon attenuation protein/uracil phosphoribosyltransferase